MTTFYPTIKALFVVTFMFVVASAAQAQTRTWVSGVGDDLNPCSRTIAPWTTIPRTQTDERAGNFSFSSICVICVTR